MPHFYIYLQRNKMPKKDNFFFIIFDEIYACTVQRHL